MIDKNQFINENKKTIIYIYYIYIYIYIYIYNIHSWNPPFIKRGFEFSKFSKKWTAGSDFSYKKKGVFLKKDLLPIFTN